MALAVAYHDCVLQCHNQNNGSHSQSPGSDEQKPHQSHEIHGQRHKNDNQSATKATTKLGEPQEATTTATKSPNDSHWSRDQSHRSDKHSHERPCPQPQESRQELWETVTQSHDRPQPGPQGPMTRLLGAMYDHSLSNHSQCHKSHV